jgi:phospholipase/carboxylesterase
MAALDSLAHRVRPSAGDPAGALVLLHGRGTDEHDLFPLLDMLDPERHLIGFTPRAPLTLPPGGSHWYISREVGRPDPDTFRSTFALVASWLDGLPEATGVPWERTVLGGFSQGAVMTYALGLGEGRPSPAALIALSGFIPVVPGFELDLESRRGLPVAIGHGTHDPVISVEFSRQARPLLEQAGLTVTYRESPMAHGVDPGYLGELSGWIRDALPAQPGQ